MSRHDEGSYGHDFDMDDNASDDINNVPKNLLQILPSQKTDSPTEVNLHHNKTTNFIFWKEREITSVKKQLDSKGFYLHFQNLAFPHVRRTEMMFFELVKEWDQYF